VVETTAALVQGIFGLAGEKHATIVAVATTPEQVRDNVRASGVTLSGETLAQIDEVLGDVVERNPERTKSPNPRPFT